MCGTSGPRPISEVSTPSRLPLAAITATPSEASLVAVRYLRPCLRVRADERFSLIMPEASNPLPITGMSRPSWHVGSTCIYTVDIAENHQRLAAHHRGEKPRQLVVVGKHQFGHRYGVVFIYHGYDIVVEHHLHAMFLIEVMAAWRNSL